MFHLGRAIIGVYHSNNDKAYMIHDNLLGSTSMLTAPAGSVITDFTFYPWGQVWNAGPAYEYHFAGFEDLYSWGLYPTINRKYAYDLGRWLSPDKLGGDVTNPQSLNRYPYVLNNPESMTDPTGLQGYGIEDDYGWRQIMDLWHDAAIASQWYWLLRAVPPPNPPKPPVMQPTINIAGMGNASFPNGSNVCSE